MDVWFLYNVLCFQIMYLSAMNCIFVSSPKFICWNHNLQFDGIWGWRFWEVIRSWGWSPHYTKGLVPLEEETERACFLSLLSTVWSYNEKMVITKPGRQHSPRAYPCWDPWTSRTVRNKSLLCKAPSLEYFCYNGLNWLGYFL